MATRGNIEQGKSAELGPRLTLQLIKIEDGLMDGEVLFHDLIEKTEEEKEAIRKSREAKKKLKEKRKKIQDDNTKRKEHAKEVLKEKSLQGMKNKTGDDEDNDEETNKNKNSEVKRPKKRRHEGEDDWQVEDDDDDAQYYREEVGEEPDRDLFSSKTTGFQRPKTFHAFKKKPRMDGNSQGGHGKFNKGGNKFNKDGDRFNKNKNRQGGGGGGGKFGNKDGRNNKFGNNKGKNTRQEKTNASNRDFRPIGVKTGKNVRKFSGKKR